MPRIILAFIGLALVMGSGVAIAAWPRAGAPAVAGVQTLAQLQTAYERVVPGVTPLSQLTKLGFDTAGATRLSYLGVVEHFMPADSAGFDALVPSVRDCLTAENRCAAYVFHARGQGQSRIVLLIESGRVTFKTLSGRMGQAAELTAAD